MWAGTAAFSAQEKGFGATSELYASSLTLPMRLVKRVPSHPQHRKSSFVRRYVGNRVPRVFSSPTHHGTRSDHEILTAPLGWARQCAGLLRPYPLQPACHSIGFLREHRVYGLRRTAHALGVTAHAETPPLTRVRWLPVTNLAREAGRYLAPGSQRWRSVKYWMPAADATMGPYGVWPLAYWTVGGVVV